MVVTLETVVVGKGSKVSQKGNQYNVLTFMDGADTVNAMTNAGVNFENIETLAPCELTLDVNLGRYMKVEKYKIILENIREVDYLQNVIEIAIATDQLTDDEKEIAIKTSGILEELYNMTRSK